MSKIALLKTKSFQFAFIIALVVGIGFAFAVDTDNDGMSDLYEEFFNLNSTNSVDAAYDYDSDSLTNLTESLLWTDPWVVDTDADGFGDGTDDNPLSRAVIMWGHPDYTTGDTYAYTGPQWWLGAGKSGGAWAAGEYWEVPAQEQGELYIDLDRATLSSNLVFGLLHESSTNSAVYIALEDATGTLVATNLFGDITDDGNTQVLSRYALPLTDYPTATRIIIGAEAGTQPYKVWAASLYVDADADGLDEDQELQIGTLDTTPDYDLDTLSDYVEAIIYGTNPLDPDTDGDGFSDGEEVNNLGSSPTVPMWEEGGTPGALQVERWNDVPGFHVSDLTKSTKFGATPDAYSWVSTSEYSANIGGVCGIRMRGTITAPSDGEYTFWLTGDDAAEVWLSETDSPYGRKRILELEGWTNYRQLSSWRVNPSEPITLSSNQSYYIEVLFKEGGGADHVTLWWTRPGQTDPEIIGAEHLHSYVQPTDDQDMDGLPDALESAAGLNPQDGTGGGYLDSDVDGFSDHEEINFMGTSPTIPVWQEGGIPGTLMVERWDNISGSQISDLLGSERFGGAPDGVEWISTFEYSANTGGACGIRIRGTLTSPADGDYTFRVTGDDSARVWLSETGSPYQRKQILDLAGWTGYRDLSNAKVHASEPITLASNQTCYVEILLKEGGGADHVTLWWTRPGATEPEIIGSEYLHSYVQPADDLDGDGLPDALETAGGLDPLDGTGGGHLDTDGDGFSDLDEIVNLGTSATVPMWQDGGIPGTLLVDRWNDIEGNAITELVENPRFGSNPDACSLVAMAEHPPNSGDKFGARMRGTLTAPVDGTYTFWLTGDDSAQVWLSDSEIPFDKELILDLASYTGYRALSNPQVHGVPVVLASNQACYVEILLKEGGGGDHVTLWWTRPGESAPEIIGAEYLNSYVQSADDLDMDGLPDAWETAGGLDPLDGTGGGFHDADGDLYNDFTEYRLGLSPTVVDADADGLKDGDEATITLTDPYNADTDADGTPDRVVVDSVNGADTFSRYSNHIGAPWTTVGDSVVCGQVSSWSEPSHVVYEITVPTSGIHHLVLRASWANGLPAPVDRAGMVFSLDGYTLETVHADGTGTYTLYTPWLADGTHRLTCNPEPPASGDYRGMSFDLVEVAAIDGVDADGNGIQDWMQARMGADVDSDGDGILDIDEISLGTDPLNPDTDGDGLLDYEELYTYSTDVANPDTDGDGISDGEEVLHALTNPLVADFGDSTVLLEMNGSSYVSSICSWQAEGTYAYARDRNGTLGYTLPVASNGNYVLEIEVAEHSTYVFDSTFDLSVALDGILIDRAVVAVGQGQPGLLKVWLPNVEAGDHSVLLKWNNIYAGSSLQVNALRLLSYDGPDANGNDRADWLDTRLQNLVGELVYLQSSPVSPVCLEGTSQNHALVAVTVDFVPSDGEPQAPAAQKGIADGWYANVMLNPYADTTLGVGTAPGLEPEEISVDWSEMNVMTIPSNTTMTIRLNDALLLSAIPEGAKQGSMILYIDGPSFTTNMVTVTEQPVPYVFEEAGTYIINGFYSKSRAVQFNGNSATNIYGFHTGEPAEGVFNEGNTETNTVSLMVEVVDARFGTDPYVADSSRKWACPSMPTNMVVESDAGVVVTSQPIDPAGREFTLDLIDQEEQTVLARLGENGPVVDRATIHPLVFGTGNYWKLVSVFPDGSMLGMLQIALSEVPEDLVIEMNVIIAGTTFADGSLSMTLTAADFNEEGVATYYMIQSGSHPSVCHVIEIRQGDEVIDN